MKEQKQKAVMIPFVAILTIAGAIAGCGGGSSENDGSPGDVSLHTCSMPCLAASPVLSAAEISSSTGGQVKVTFDLRGEITNVETIGVILSSDDLFYGTLDVAGSADVIYPSSAHQELIIDVEAGTPTGVYYPWINMSMTAYNTGSQYYLDPTKSTGRYTYVEVSGNTPPAPILTSFAIPKITVVP